MKLLQQLAFISCFWLLTTPTTFAQRWRYWQDVPGTWTVGFEAGTTRYAGDMSEEKDIFRYPRLGAEAGLSVARRIGYRFSVRADARVYYIWGTQKHTRVYYNNLSFFSINPDVWIGGKVDLWRVDDPNHTYNPYLLAGAGVTYLNTMTTYEGYYVKLPRFHTEGVNYSRYPGIIRYGIGIPFDLGMRTRIAIEGTYTHVLNDYLDDVSTTYPDFSKVHPLVAAISDRRSEIGLAPNKSFAQRGNPSKRDGYAALAIRLTYQVNSSSWNRYRNGLRTPF
ncbi:hypothetical protein [Arsenicibacter rosenii]|uniref:Outer membrane protein beta-barrel domain-containing protein n=1 Tax=Arsenicibacter rosenii TaxID=1750698 RepID=A0A1S2VGD5_9BACT|nr:hypothetical protein [Arsenicibacter rosenii]OIN57827.1 hypothetical protein BLX24_17155 [Arsenicibacter rosenii]